MIREWWSLYEECRLAVSAPAAKRAPPVHKMMSSYSSVERPVMLLSKSLEVKDAVAFPDA